MCSSFLKDHKYEIIPALTWIIAWHTLVWWDYLTPGKVEECFIPIVFKSSQGGKQHGSSLWKGIFELQLARYWTSSPLFGFPRLSSSCVFSFIAAWGISFQIAPALSICWKLHNFLFSSKCNEWSPKISEFKTKKIGKKKHIFLTSPAFPAAKLRLVTPYSMHLHA